MKMIKKSFKLVICFVLLFSMIFQPRNIHTVSAATFANGADVSWVPAMEASGYTWKDKNGVKRDILEILKNDYNINSIRLRVFVNPSGDKGNGWCDVTNTVNMAKRAKNLGLRVMIDFHYSDSWADPGQQTKPAAWKNYTFDQLMTAVYNHTLYVMNQLKAAGVTPEWVQVGNETNNGMLWDDGKASTNMKNFAWLINCGYNAVKAVSSSTKVIVHLANGNDASVFSWMFKGLVSNGAKFDVIGMSLYPTSSNWSSLNASAYSNMKSLVSAYNKEIMVCESGMEYYNASACKSFLSDTITKVKSLPNSKGIGVFYWEPEAYPGWNNYQKGAWNSDGKPNGALEAFK